MINNLNEIQRNIYERVEVQAHEGNPSDGTTELEVHISEREFSPGQLELQRRVALAQSKREVKQHSLKSTLYFIERLITLA